MHRELLTDQHNVCDTFTISLALCFGVTGRSKETEDLIWRELNQLFNLSSATHSQTL